MSLNINLPFQSERHTAVLQALLARRDLAERELPKFRDKWHKNDEYYKGFIKESEVTKKSKESKREEGKLNYYTIEIPYSYAVAFTAFTYWSTIYLSRTPIFQYSGRNSASQQSVQAVEALIDYQLRNGGSIVPLFTGLLDLAKYGIGVLWEYWDKEVIQMSSIEEQEAQFANTIVEGTTKKVRTTEQFPGYEGNRIFNIRPHDIIPDPRVPLSELQRGEFFGRYTDSSWNDLVRGREQNLYMNLDVVERIGLAQDDRDHSYGRAENAPLRDVDNLDISARVMSVANVNLIEMVVDLIPKDWKLGESDFPEKWIFTVANEQVIIGARPLGHRHGKFPVSVMEFDPSSQELIKNGLVDLTAPMSDAITWLINTHFWNVRKTLNDTRIVDPSRVVLSDLLEPKLGGIIRLREEAWGTDPRLAIHQLNSIDVTQNHLRDINSIETLIQRVTGVVDNIMGMVNTSGRKTATEVRTASGFSMNRLKTVAEYNSHQAFAPLSQRLVMNSQQFFSDELELKILGNLTKNAEQFLNVTPENIAGFYDFVAVDGTLPVDRLAQANFWKELIATVARAPNLAPEFDLSSMVMHTMKLIGEQNVDAFKVKVSPDQEVLQNVQAGNLI